MASVTKYPSTISQTTGSNFVSWDNLDNLKKNVTDNHAVSHTMIQGKYELNNTPSPIHASNFKFNIPEGAEPTKLIVEYRYRKVQGNDYSSTHKDRVMNIPGPVISVTAIGDVKGVSPTTTMSTNKKTFNIDGKVTRELLNSSGFSVNFLFLPNTNRWDGYMRFAYLRVTVEYRTSTYSVSVKKIGGTGYNEDDYTVSLMISNKNGTEYQPTLTLTTPPGFSFKRKDKGNGIVTTVNARTFHWYPELKKGVGSATVELVFSTNVTFPSGSDTYTGTFTLSESLNNASNTHNATIKKKTPAKEEDIHGDEPLGEGGTASVEELTVINVIAGNDFKLNLPSITDNLYTVNFIVFDFYNIGYDDISYDGVCIKEEEDDKIQYYLQYDILEGNWIITKPQKYLVSAEIHYSDAPLPLSVELVKFYINVMPREEDLTIPSLSLLTLSEEELARLGTGYSYIVQSYMKHESEDVNIRDWYKNNRIGVFNNAIKDNITVETVEVDGELVDIVTDNTDYTNLTPAEIFTYADYWSENTAGLNDYENLECEFTYNTDYPLYIILAGDYPEAVTYGFDGGALTYTEPCVIEKVVYSKWQPTGTYPTPISNMILNDGSTAETGIPTLNTTDTVIVYDYPLAEGYGNTEKMSIRGLEVTGTIEQSDELILFATFTNTDGVKGQRSVIINEENTTVDSDTTFKLGGLGDLWGFSSNDIHDLEDWELSITIQNSLTDTDASINLGDIQVTVYTEKLENQLINVKVNGEDLTFYGAFVENVNIPAGLKTDTSFLTIDGTDTNDAYRQNIREKTIELDLVVGECDLQTSTDMLRQLTQLLVNDKDKYHRPIPNVIEFSHYPDVYFEYILVDTLDVDLEVGEYIIKAKLTIPSGTSYDKTSTTTNVTGVVQGVAAINPIITFKPQAEAITITESVSGQVFHMAYAGDWQSKVIEIDCEDRRVYAKEDEDSPDSTDITRYVDFDVDWFSLHGEYAFTGTGCVIRTVNFVERW